MKICDLKTCQHIRKYKLSGYVWAHDVNKNAGFFLLKHFGDIEFIVCLCVAIRAKNNYNVYWLIDNEFVSSEDVIKRYNK